MFKQLSKIYNMRVEKPWYLLVIVLYYGLITRYNTYYSVYKIAEKNISYMFNVNASTKLFRHRLH